MRVGELRDALRSTSLAFVEVDRAGRIRDWNPAAQRLFGWSRTEVLGRSLADVLIPAALRAAHCAAFARRLVAGDDTWPGRRVEMPACHRDGSELRVSLIVDATADGFCAFISDETDWHRAQQELQRSTTLVNAILEHTSALISAKDLAGRYLFVNREYERVFEVAAADLVGRHDTEVLPDVVAAAGRPHDRQVVTSGEAITALEELPFGDEIRQYVVTRFPLTDPDGSIYGVCAVAIDDTARRRSEEALSASERRFRATVNNAPGMLFQFRVGVDGTQSFPFVSDGCREMFGVEPSAVLADPCLVTDMVAEEERATFATSVTESIVNLQPWRWQGSVIRHDGERRWLHGVARPYRLADGSTLSDGMLVDRTDEHCTELKLEAGRRDLDELTRRLAVYRFTAVAGAGGRPELLTAEGNAAAVFGAADPAEDLAAALATVLDPAELAAAWATALGGAGADLDGTLPGDPAGRRLWLRLRPADRDGRRVVEGSCFDPDKT